MLKVMSIVGTRPEIIKMSCVISKFDAFTEHTLVHTGQNYDYELSEIFFTELAIRKPDHFLGLSGETAAQNIAQVIEKSDAVMRHVQPDALLLYGDTNSCLSVISAKRQKIPVFHMEAGNRCFDQRVPEELNRKVVDHLSDINMVLTEHARRYLIAEGVKPETIIKTGSHMPEVLNTYKGQIERSTILSDLTLMPGNYFLFSLHREENIDPTGNISCIIKTLNTVAQRYDLPVIVSTHPRTRKKLEQFEHARLEAHVRFLKPFGFFDYIQLQKNACAVLSDSGTITEEAALLNIPAITIRETHERPEGMDSGILMMCSLDPEKVLLAIDATRSSYEKPSQHSLKVEDYRSTDVSDKVLNIVLSYTDYINRTVWKK